MGNINWNLTANEEQFVGAMLRATNKLREVGEAGQAAGRKTQGVFANASKEALGFVGALTGIGSAVGGMMAIVGQIKAEYEHLNRQRREAAAEQITVGEARAVALMNKPGDVDQGYVDKLVEDVAKNQKIDQKRLWPLIGQLLSSKGSLSMEGFEKAFREAASVGALAGEGIDMSVLGGGLQDVMRVTGVKDPAQAGGWIRSIGQQSRIVDLDKQIRAIVPVVSGASEFQATPQQAAGLMAYMTMMSGDIEGRKSSTGATKFMQQLMEATTESGAILPTAKSTREGKLPFGKGANAMKFKPLTGKTFEERLTEVQDWYATADQSLRAEFIGKLEGEAKTKGALISLIARKPNALAALATAKAGIPEPSSARAGRQWTNWFQEVGAGKYEAVRDVSIGGKSAAQQMQLANPDAWKGELKQQLSDVMDKTPNMALITKQAHQFSMAVSGNKFEAARAAINDMRMRTGGYKYEANAKPTIGDIIYNNLWATGGSLSQSWPSQTDTQEYDSEGLRKITYRENPNYNAAAGEALDTLTKSIDRLCEQLKQTPVDKTQDVQIVGDKRTIPINPAHGE